MKKLRKTASLFFLAMLFSMTVSVNMPIPEGNNENFGVARWVDSGPYLFSAQ